MCEINHFKIYVLYSVVMWLADVDHLCAKKLS
jgi:hypothetical protein